MITIAEDDHPLGMIVSRCRMITFSGEGGHLR
jgi:hypothetical protein